MERLARVLEKVVTSFGYLGAGLVLLMIVLIMVEVFFRYVLDDPLMVGDEFSAYMLVAIAFLGTAYGWKTRVHVRITALTSKLPPKVRDWLRLITLVFDFALLVGLSQAGYSFMRTSFRFRVSSDSFWRTPLQVPQMTIVIGLVILALWLIVEIYRAALKVKGTEVAIKEEFQEE